MPDPALRIHLDLVGGLAGDMFVAALLDAFPEQRDPLLALLRQPGLAAPVEVRVETHRGASLVGLRFVVGEPAREAAQRRSARPMHTHDGHASPHEEHHDHYHRQGHVAHRSIVERLEAAPLPAPVRAHALAIFALLAVAEAAVHDVAVEAVEFHEVGAWDSIIDIVAAAFLIDAVGAGRWTHGPIPLGGGVVRTEHGVMPVPAPATLRLLHGQIVVDDGVPGERVTPTGAAILRYLDDAFAGQQRAGAERVGASGLGFGARTLSDRPNAVRCTAYQALARAATDAPTPSPLVEDWVDALEFDIDDQTGEDLAVGLDALRVHGDVLQVTQMPVIGKKGRLAMRVQVVARAGAAADVARSCFVQTTTIGLRWQRLPRFVLDRQGMRVRSADGETLAVKLASRDGAFTAKAEMDGLAPLAGGHAGREGARREAEAHALEAAAMAPASKNER